MSAVTAAGVGTAATRPTHAMDLSSFIASDRKDPCLASEDPKQKAGAVCGYVRALSAAPPGEPSPGVHGGEGGGEGGGPK